ncbi:MAG: usg protein [Pseudomonadota bacterium]
MGSTDFENVIKGYGLTTAKILYHYPDYPGVLQTFVWQDYDNAPRFPVLSKFIKFWHDEIEGPLHSVLVSHNGLVKPAEWRAAKAELVLH